MSDFAFLGELGSESASGGDGISRNVELRDEDSRPADSLGIT